MADLFGPVPGSTAQPLHNARFTFENTAESGGWRVLIFGHDPNPLFALNTLTFSTAGRTGSVTEDPDRPQPAVIYLFDYIQDKFLMKTDIGETDGHAYLKHVSGVQSSQLHSPVYRIDMSRRVASGEKRNVLIKIEGAGMGTPRVSDPLLDVQRLDPGKSGAVWYDMPVADMDVLLNPRMCVTSPCPQLYMGIPGSLLVLMRNFRPSTSDHTFHRGTIQISRRNGVLTSVTRPLLDASGTVPEDIVEPVGNWRTFEQRIRSEGYLYFHHLVDGYHASSGYLSFPDRPPLPSPTLPPPGIPYNDDILLKPSVQLVMVLALVLVAVVLARYYMS